MSDEIPTPKKRGRPAKVKPEPVRVDVLERASQTDLDTLLSDPRYKARLSQPFGETSQPIALVDSSKECHWFNAAIQNDHIWQKKRGGWDNVRPEDVVDTEQIGGFAVDASGHIVRGERGQEVLMSMPKVVIRAIAMKKAEINKNLGRADKQRAGAIESLGQRDPEGADFLQKAARRFDVNDSYERIEVTPDGE